MHLSEISMCSYKWNEERDENNSVVSTVLDTCYIMPFIRGILYVPVMLECVQRRRNYIRRRIIMSSLLL